MDDLGILWYILAAIIYILSRRMKKKTPVPPEGTENNPVPRRKALTIEDLLREVTGEREPEEVYEPGKKPEKDQESHHFEEMGPDKEEMGPDKENAGGKTGQRAFADEESRRIYEESIAQAEDGHRQVESQSKVLFKQDEEEGLYSFADEIREDLSGGDARKAIIYSEIINRKY